MGTAVDLARSLATKGLGGSLRPLQLRVPRLPRAMAKVGSLLPPTLDLCGGRKMGFAIALANQDGPTACAPPSGMTVYDEREG